MSDRNAVRVVGDALVVTPRGLDKVWGFRRRVIVPLARITEVAVEETPHAVKRGLRAPGLDVYWKRSGTFHPDSGRHYWNQAGSGPVLSIEIAGGKPFDRLYLSVPDPASTRDRVEAAVRAHAISAFWAECRSAIPELAAEQPEAWAFGATPEHADELLALVLAGTKAGTASSLWDYEYAAEPVPAAGELSIILDGAGAPRALIETTAVDTVSFAAVTAAHARAEGEGDRSLEAWREIHERYWRRHSENPRGYEPDMPVVCERFRVRFPLE